MQYLVERYDEENKISYPAGTREGVEVSVSRLLLTVVFHGPLKGLAEAGCQTSMLI